MKTYRVTVTAHAEAQMDRHLSYIIERLHNPQAAEGVYADFMATARSLATAAGSIGAPRDEALLQRGLKCLNFSRHNCFLLYYIEGDTACITNVFHFRENSVAKLE